MDNRKYNLMWSEGKNTALALYQIAEELRLLREAAYSAEREKGLSVFDQVVGAIENGFERLANAGTLRR
ncbi:MAG: hypothetical protein KKD44_28975 [Proteobacteria bacterium]|nr:hypothetical protein [Pseudomonadota bacterium]HUW96777.1 hypothetical protein [Anaerolineae bacterium]